MHDDHLIDPAGKDLERPLRDEKNKSESEVAKSHHRMNKIADEMAERGTNRERTSEPSVIPETDPHGTHS